MKLGAMKLGVAAAVLGAGLLTAPAQGDTTTSRRNYVHTGRLSVCVLAEDTENLGGACWYVAPGAEIQVSVDDAVAAPETVGLSYTFFGHHDRLTTGVFCGAATLVAPEGATHLDVRTQDPIVEQTYDPSRRSNCGGVPTRGVLTATGVLPSHKFVAD